MKLSSNHSKKKAPREIYSSISLSKPRPGTSKTKKNLFQHQSPSIRPKTTNILTQNNKDKNRVSNSLQKPFDTKLSHSSNSLPSLKSSPFLSNLSSNSKSNSPSHQKHYHSFGIHKSTSMVKSIDKNKSSIRRPATVTMGIKPKKKELIFPKSLQSSIHTNISSQLNPLQPISRPTTAFASDVFRLVPFQRPQSRPQYHYKNIRPDTDFALKKMEERKQRVLNKKKKEEEDRILLEETAKKIKEEEEDIKKKLQEEQKPPKTTPSLDSFDKMDNTEVYLSPPPFPQWDPFSISPNRNDIISFLCYLFKKNNLDPCDRYQNFFHLSTTFYEDDDEISTAFNAFSIISKFLLPQGSQKISILTPHLCTYTFQQYKKTTTKINAFPPVDLFYRVETELALFLCSKLNLNPDGFLETFSHFISYIKK